MIHLFIIGYLIYAAIAGLYEYYMQYDPDEFIGY